MDRRCFLLLAAGTLSGCATAELAAPQGERIVSAGPVADFAADGVHDKFRDQGFFIIRHGEKLFVLSAICTHRNCKLRAQTDQSFRCKCHGSTFDPAGHVTKGPAKRDLPVLTAATDENGNLLVTVPAI